MILAPKHKFFITALSSLLILVGLGWLWWFLISGIETFKDALYDVRLKIVAQEEERKSARQLASLMKARRIDLEKTDSLLIDKEKPIEFIEGVESLARKTGSRMFLGVEGSVDPAGFMNFKLNIEDTERGARSFLEMLTLMPYEILVEDINFQKISSVPVTLPDGKNFAPTARLGILIKVKTQ